MNRKFICVFSKEDKENLISKGLKLIDSQVINGQDYFYFINDKKKYEQYDMQDVKHLYTDILFL